MPVLLAWANVLAFCTGFFLDFFTHLSCFLTKPRLHFAGFDLDLTDGSGAAGAARFPAPENVWLDGAQIGQVAPGRRSALVADGGARTLCLLVPGAAQCGDRWTGRQVYLHDGWSVTMHCPK